MVRQGSDEDVRDERGVFARLALGVRDSKRSVRVAALLVLGLLVFAMLGLLVSGGGAREHDEALTACEQGARSVAKAAEAWRIAAAKAGPVLEEGSLGDRSDLVGELASALQQEPDAAPSCARGDDADVLHGKAGQARDQAEQVAAQTTLIEDVTGTLSAVTESAGLRDARDGVAERLGRALDTLRLPGDVRDPQVRASLFDAVTDGVEALADREVSASRLEACAERLRTAVDSYRASMLDVGQ